MVSAAQYESMQNSSLLLIHDVYFLKFTHCQVALLWPFVHKEVVVSKHGKVKEDPVQLPKQVCLNMTSPFASSLYQ